MLPPKLLRIAKTCETLPRLTHSAGRIAGLPFGLPNSAPPPGGRNSTSRLAAWPWARGAFGHRSQVRTPAPSLEAHREHDGAYQDEDGQEEGDGHPLPER